jgi:hypothetical protein
MFYGNFYRHFTSIHWEASGQPSHQGLWILDVSIESFSFVAFYMIDPVKGLDPGQ